MKNVAVMERSSRTRTHLRQLMMSKGIVGPVAVVGLAYLLILLLYPVLRGYTSPLDYAHIGQYYCCGNYPHTSVGYDGQFYDYIATDPLHAPAQMDDAPYRYHRILYPMIVWALSLGGNPHLVPWMLLIVNVLGTLAGTLALALLLRRHMLSPWFSLALGLYFGQFASISHDVPDGFAVALVAFGALAIDRGRWKEALFWLAAAGLTRETTLVFAAGATVQLVLHRQPGRAALMLCAGIPFTLWLLVLKLLFGDSGLFFSGAQVVSSSLAFPFRGLLGIAHLSPRFVISLLVIVVPALLALGWIVAEVLKKRWLVAPGWLFVMLVHIWLAASLITFVYGDLASSTRVCIGLPLAWLLYAVARQSRPLLWLASPWALGVALYAFAVIMHLQSIII